MLPITNVGTPVKCNLLSTLLFFDFVDTGYAFAQEAGNDMLVTTQMAKLSMSLSVDAMRPASKGMDFSSRKSIQVPFEDKEHKVVHHARSELLPEDENLIN